MEYRHANLVEIPEPALDMLLDPARGNTSAAPAVEYLNLPWHVRPVEAQVLPRRQHLFLDQFLAPTVSEGEPQAWGFMRQFIDDVLVSGLDQLVVDRSKTDSA